MEKYFSRILVTQKDLIHKMGKDLIGHAGHGILFLDCRRYPFHGAPKKDRPANIAARAYNKIRFDSVHQVVGVAHSADQSRRAFERSHTQMAFKPGDADKFQRISISGNNIPFESLTRPDKGDFRIRDLVPNGSAMVRAG